MGIEEHIDQEIACQLLRYEPNTGLLYWMPRPIHFFKTEKDFRRWNTVYADKEAFTSDNGDGYKCGSVLGKNTRAHRLIWLMVYGWLPEQIDHINRDRSDNRIDNLRAANASENMRNQKCAASNRSGHAGVHWYSPTRKWCARITHEGKRIFLGYFNELSEAIAARMNAEKELKYGVNQHDQPADLPASFGYVH
jgi:hypothetical protein